MSHHHDHLAPSHLPPLGRAALTDELHARSILPLYGEYYIHHLAYSGPRALGLAYVEQLHEYVNEEAPSQLSKHEIFKLGGALIKWEQHTEFFSITVFEQDRERPFQRAVLPLTKLASDLELEMLVDMRLLVQRSHRPPNDCPEEFRDYFNDVSLCGVSISGGGGSYFTDYRLSGEDQATFHLLLDHGMTPHQLGRQVVRVIEVENYRVLAMLGYHYTQSLHQRLAELENGTQGLISMIGATAEGEGRELLDEVISLSMRAEQLIAESQFRINATRAYTQLLYERIESLRGVKINVLRDLSGFMDRRLTPSVRTVESFGDRLLRLSARLDRSSNLIRTRVDVKIEEQNSALLRSMDRRARLQLRLQSTVEGLSVIALSYYSLGLIGYLVTPIAKYIDLSPKLVTGGFALPVLLTIYWVTQRIHSMSHMKRDAHSTD